MDEDNIPRIKEDIKRDILKYLFNGIKENLSIDYFTYSDIINFIDEDSEKIDPILEELKEEKTISSHDVSFEIYIPKCDAGNEFIDNLKVQEVLVFSPFWMMAFSLVIFLVISNYVMFPLDESFRGKTLDDAYLRGIQFAILASIIVGPFGGKTLHGIAMKLIRMKMLSPERYNQMYEVVKTTLIISGMIVVIYPTALKTYGLQFTNYAIIIFLSALSLSIAYVSLRARIGD